VRPPSLESPGEQQGDGPGRREDRRWSQTGFRDFVRLKWNRPGVKLMYAGTLIFGTLVLAKDGVAVFLAIVAVALPGGLLLQWRQYRTTGRL
jgi:hypothetical protein